MLHIRIKLLFFFLAFAHISIGQSVKSVHKHIAEKDFEKAKEKIEKLRAKDTFQLAALYLNSLYFLDSANRKINIDSAYLLTNVVLAKYKYLNINDKKQKEQQDDLQDAGFSAAKMGEQKLKIEANVFEYTQRKDNTVIGWQIYLQKYPTAKQVLQAEEKRNELAFAFAQKENTFQAYKTFIDKYPQAKQDIIS
jgi:prophage maintenance system killer protein